MIGMFLVVIGGFSLIMNSIYVFLQIHKKYSSGVGSNSNNNNNRDDWQEALNTIIGYANYVLQYRCYSQKDGFITKNARINTENVFYNPYKTYPPCGITRYINPIILKDCAILSLFVTHDSPRYPDNIIKFKEFKDKMQIRVVIYWFPDKKQYTIIIPIKYEPLLSDQENYVLDINNIKQEPNNEKFIISSNSLN